MKIGISDYKKIKNSGILNESIENNAIDTKKLDKNHFLFSSGYFSKSDTILNMKKYLLFLTLTNGVLNN